VVDNGLQAVDAVQRGTYDVILMDIQMPELDGIGATREIRALAQPKSAVPIIALTANAMQGAEKRYLEAGMNAYISKPIRSAELFAKLAELADPAALDMEQTGVPGSGPSDRVCLRPSPPLPSRYREPYRLHPRRLRQGRFGRLGPQRPCDHQHRGQYRRPAGIRPGAGSWTGSAAPKKAGTSPAWWRNL